MPLLLPDVSGFDPLGVVKSDRELLALREAEIKHARLAMLGSLGWPVSELYHVQLAEKLGLPNLLQNGKVPSVLNGGLTNEYVLVTLFVLMAVGAFLGKEERFFLLNHCCCHYYYYYYYNNNNYY